MEVGTAALADLPAVRSIAKIPQAHAGFTYVGAYILPFRDCSYVVKIHCEERGFTGTREAVLAAMRHSPKGIALAEASGDWDFWTSDNEIHDDRFPDHPLSRCRRGLRMIAESLTFADDFRALPEFGLPTDGA